MWHPTIYLQLLFQLTAAARDFDPTALKFSCHEPTNGGVNPMSTPGEMVYLNPLGVSTLYDTQTILLAPIPSADEPTNAANSTYARVGRMCILSRWTHSTTDKALNKGFYYPLGKSYDGRDWQRPPGKGGHRGKLGGLGGTAAGVRLGVEYTCDYASNSGDDGQFAAGEYLCEVTLPMTSKVQGNGQLEELDIPYYLTYYERSLSVRAELSRFLHRVTFGPTPSELDSLEATFETLRLDHPEWTYVQTMEQLQREWTDLQINHPTSFSSGKFSSLREYWRKRLNGRGFETYPIGEYGPHPCEAKSRWRKYAFVRYDVENSERLFWGTVDIGGVYQEKEGHKMTVEKVMGVLKPEGSIGTKDLLTTPSTTPLTTSHSIVGRGDMEGPLSRVNGAWPTLGAGCVRQVLSTASDAVWPTTSDMVYQGTQSVKLHGGSCSLYRQLGPGCPTDRVGENVRAGDVLRISLRIKVLPQTGGVAATISDGVIFQIITAHYHGSKGWTKPEDGSYVVSRTFISPEEINNEEWVYVEAIHEVGPDWTFDGQIRYPGRCNHYQLRFQLAGLDHVLDDLVVEKLYNAEEGGTGALAAPLPTHESKRGFLNNPNFLLNHKYWDILDTDSGFISYDSELERNVMVLRNAQFMRQKLEDTLTQLQAEGNSIGRRKSFRFTFWVRLVGITEVTVGARIRQRLVNYDTSGTSVCGTRAFCNRYIHPVEKTIVDDGSSQWQLVETESFQFFDVTKENVGFDDVFISVGAGILPDGAEVRIGNFDMVGYILRYAGDIRTVIGYPFQIDNHEGAELPMDGSVEYPLCYVDEVEGNFGEDPIKRFMIRVDNKCVALRGGNPTVDIDPEFVDYNTIHTLDLSSSSHIEPVDVEHTFGGDWLLQSDVEDEGCSTFPSPYDNDYRGADPQNPDAEPSRFNPDKPVFSLLPDGGHAIYDPRLIIKENTLEEPLLDGGGGVALRSALRLNYAVKPHGNRYNLINGGNIVMCTNEQPNFLNQDSCKLSYEPNACIRDEKARTDVDATITFDDATLASMHSITSRYIYAISNLRYDDSNTDGTVDLPCSDNNPRSRWKKKPDLTLTNCTNSLHVDSVSALKFALETSNDENTFLRDIYLWNTGTTSGGCNEVDSAAYGMKIMTSEGCMENVHPDYMSIFDMTRRASSDTSLPLYTDSGIYVYPDENPMSSFEEMKAIASEMKYVARYGDKMKVIDFAGFPLYLDTNPEILINIANNLSSSAVKKGNMIGSNRGGGVLVCGSPNEVASTALGDGYFDVVQQDNIDCIGCLNAYGNYYDQKLTVWAINALEAEDQLCQRMAWALYLHLNTGPASHENALTESNLYTYDVHTRNCFGNYFDALKEMVFNPAMGEQFMYVLSSSTRYIWDLRGWLVSPDENFAREVMQLYTIGMHYLESDGAECRDEFGKKIMAYNNFNIMTNARIFTGFEYTARRGNTEVLFRANKSRMEPMRIDVDKHDFFPKISVDNGWVGDRYPLCSDLPDKHFLKLGATFRFRGGSSIPTTQYSPEWWEFNESIKRFVLSPESSLYQKLCKPDANKNCRFDNTVTLDSNVPCHGIECAVDTVVIVQVAPGAFYEYIRAPCVQLTFFDDGKKVVAGGSEQYTHAMCSNPRLASAARMCCFSSSAFYQYKTEYHGEVVTAKSNEDQCIADGGYLCDPSSFQVHNSLFMHNAFDTIASSSNIFYWTNETCTQQAKVRGDGMVALTHLPSSNPEVTHEVPSYVDMDNAVTYIKVHWDVDALTGEEIYPVIENNCGNGACAVLDTECLCSVAVEESFVFESLPTRSSLSSALKVGAFDPNSYGTYFSHSLSDDVEVFVSSDAPVIGSTSTIFKVTDEFGETAFFKNIKSTVSLGGSYSMRNPVGFIDIVKPERRDVEHEVDAFLKHLLALPSAAPFISKKLIQYFGTSNPSPSYVERVTQAFRSGVFVNGDATFGSLGEFGNLGAVAAAIVLDPESLNPVMDADPAFGNVREPMLKIIQAMRTLSFQRKSNVGLRYGIFHNSGNRIGEMPFQPPNQFSFFSSDHTPVGFFSNVDMVSPESQTASMTSMVGITNGLFSLVNYGLTGYNGGFGPDVSKNPGVGDYTSSVGMLTYQASDSDAESKVEDLAILLTAGRLSDENKQTLVNAYNFFEGSHNAATADNAVRQLMMSTPEFHTTNTVKKTGEPRLVTTPTQPKDSSYKAIVYIHLFGGADSFNILTPHNDNGCYLYEDYLEARGGIGLTIDKMLTINGTSAGIEGCNTFGVHKLLSAYKDIYDEGKGVFIANMGHLHKPVNRGNWYTETTTDLFSHSTMKAETLRVDAFSEAGRTGILGRMLDILERDGFSVSSSSIDKSSPMVAGDPNFGRMSDVFPSDSVPTLYEHRFLNEESQVMREYLENLHSQTKEDSGVFSDLWSQKFLDVWNKTDSLKSTLGSINTVTAFAAGRDPVGINSKLKRVAELIIARSQRGNGINRDVFYVEMGGFDMHSSVLSLLENALPPLNTAVANFWAEIKALQLENSVFVVQGSEFGRTINPNSNQGSDHAWGGNYFAFGGEVSGGKIMGKYPSSFGVNDPTNVGRGRLIPTTSWDALWYGAAQWFGITDPLDLGWVLPNSGNFGCDLFTDKDIFTSGTHDFVRGCGGPEVQSTFQFFMSNPRFLTGEEQREICKLAVDISTKRLKLESYDVRCWVSNQSITDHSPKFNVQGDAILHFDSSVTNVNQGVINTVSREAEDLASQFVVIDSLPYEAPSMAPTQSSLFV